MGSWSRWKWATEYNRGSIAETAKFRVKQLFRGYDSQVASAMTMARALNKMSKAGMPERVRITLKPYRLQGRSAGTKFIQ